MAHELHERLKAARLLQHPGEGGRARENLLRDFLQQMVPTGFSVGTGFVIDSAGSMSRQQDIVVVREGYHPVFRVGMINHYIIEAVAAVIEVKARIESAAKLQHALDNGASVKALDRTGGRTNYVVQGGCKGEYVDSERHDHQVFSAIVAVDSMAAESCREPVREWMQRHPRRVWPNAVASVQRFSMAYASSEPRCDPMLATVVGFAAATVEESENTHPILDLLEQLLSFLRVTPLIDFQPSVYLPGSHNISNQFHAP